MPSKSKSTSGAHKNTKNIPDTPVTESEVKAGMNTQPDTEPIIKEVDAPVQKGGMPPDTGETNINIIPTDTPVPQEVFVEHFDLSAAYISVFVNAKISPKQYETREAGISMKLPLDPEAGASARKAMSRAMFAECRKLVSEQLSEISKM